MLPIIMLVFSLIKREYIKPCLLVIVIAVSVHLFWLIPKVIDYNKSVSTINSLVTNEQLIERSPPLLSVPILMGYIYFIQGLGNWGLIPWLIGAFGLILLLLFDY